MAQSNLSKMQSLSYRSHSCEERGGGGGISGAARPGKMGRAGGVLLSKRCLHVDHPRLRPPSPPRISCL